MATAANRIAFPAPCPERRHLPSDPIEPPDASSNAVLAARLQRGEDGSLDLVYYRFAGPLLQLAARLTGSPQTGEDVVHDVFVGLPDAMAGYRESGQFDRWLRRIVTRRALDYLRRSARRQEVDVDADVECVHAAYQPDVTTRMVLDAAIAALPDALRTVFVLRAVEGYTHAEIADVLGILRGTSEVRFFRAIRALRVTLEETD
jgi:RNA polymerase sigma-70 factor (ECF subfamily)